LANPLMQLEQGPDGAVSVDGQVIGTYVHGLFEAPQACQAILRWAGLEQAQTLDYRAVTEAAIERLADAIEQALDLDRIEAMLVKQD